MKEHDIGYQIHSAIQVESNHVLEESHSVLKYYERAIATPQKVNIGSVSQLAPIHTNEMPPLALREYEVHYPNALIEGYKIACEEYDKQFMEIVARHKTWESDYQYAPCTLAFQVDGPAYSDEFLSQAGSMNPTVLAEFMMKRVFEFEVNIAAYGLNGRLWPDGTTNRTWRAALEQVRQRTGKKVAVLAGTEQKLDEMTLYEMGITGDRSIPAEVIRSMTGFDAFLGPNDLVSVYQNHGDDDCPYVFYGRTSRPKSWLRDPASQVDEGFLAQPEILKFVRAHALTHNFDDPTLPLNHPAVIMDTKEPLVMKGAAYLVTQLSDIYSQEFLGHLTKNGIDTASIVEGGLTDGQSKKLGKIFLEFPNSNLLSEPFQLHLRARGIDPSMIASGDKKVRAKPLAQHYGIYGHEVGSMNRAKFLKKLMRQIKTRGKYIIQPEFSNLIVVDSAHPSDSYVAIDRVFLVRGNDGALQPMESCRSLMPAQSQEGRENNVHEGPHTLCARIAI